MICEEFAKFCPFLSCLMLSATLQEAFHIESSLLLWNFRGPSGAWRSRLGPSRSFLLRRWEMEESSSCPSPAFLVLRLLVNRVCQLFEDHREVGVVAVRGAGFSVNICCHPQCSRWLKASFAGFHAADSTAKAAFNFSSFEGRRWKEEGGRRRGRRSMRGFRKKEEKKKRKRKLKAYKVGDRVHFP